MAAQSIPQRLHPLVLERKANGLSTRDIAEWLKDNHGIDVSHHTVARLLEKERKERAPIAKEIAREELSKTVTVDLQRSEQLWQETEDLKKEIRAYEPGDKENTGAFMIRRKLALKDILDVQRKLLLDRAKMAGVTEPDAALGVVILGAEREPVDDE